MVRRAGLSALKGLKLVKVATGEPSLDRESRPQNTYVMGFLLEDEGRTFTILDTNLRTRTFESYKSRDELKRIDYDEVDMGKEATDLAQNLKKMRETRDGWLRYHKLVSGDIGLFITARACAANGLKEASHQLYDETAHASQWGPDSFSDTIHRGIAHTMIQRSTWAFHDPKIPRPQLLAMFRDIAKKFPDSGLEDEVKETVAILESMVAEDEQHAKHPATAPQKMTKQEQIAELIFQLRDQNGGQSSIPGSVNVFWAPRGEVSPAKQLVKIGYDAIPQLIQTLDDKRFTRSVGGGGFSGPRIILRVGQCDKQVIEAIAGRSFEGREDIEAWWSGIQVWGEKDMLREAAARGDGNSASQGRLLVKKYPESALEALAEGVKKTDQFSVRADLIKLTGQIPGDAPVSFLTEIVKGGYGYSCKLAAAEALLHRGRRFDAITNIMDAWLGSAASTRPANWQFDNDPAYLVNFLLSCGSVEAIDALGKDLPHRPVELRLKVISAMNCGYTDDTGADLSVMQAQERDRPCLAGTPCRALADTDRAYSTTAWHGCKFIDPRVCDLAACVLSDRWPQKYKFDSGAGESKRDSQRIGLINVWREEYRLPPVPVPRPVEIAPAEPAVIDPMIKAVIEAKTAAEGTKAVAAIEALGLTALKPVLDQLGGMKKDDPAYAILGAGAPRLASVARDVVFEKDSLRPPEESAESPRLRKRQAADRRGVYCHLGCGREDRSGRVDRAAD